MRGYAFAKMMEAMAEIEEARIKGLESKLQGSDKLEYERLKEELERKNKRTWRKAKAVGAVGICTIASGLYFTARGVSDTEQKIKETPSQSIKNDNSFDEYREIRSQYLNYAWGAILAGNVICAAGLSVSNVLMHRRWKPVRKYLEDHATQKEK